MNNKYLLSIGSLVMTNCFIMWEYINGGVITHHLLADETLPGLSNWWGLITIPLVTFILLSWRDRNRSKEESLIDGLHFFLAIIYGICLCILWNTGNESIMPIVIFLPAVVSIWKPLSTISFYLGLLFGMMHTFGGILPIIAGIIIVMASFIAYHTLGRGLKLLTSG